MLNHTNSRLKNKLEIFNLLKRIQKSRQLISVSFESLPHYCLTSLIDLHHEAKVLVFDEPNPQISSKLIQVKNEAGFSLKLEKLPVLFNAGLIQNNNKNRLYAHFPNEVYYPQNRRYYRIRTEFLYEITTTIFLSSTQRLPCELINISLNGICLRFPYSFAQKFSINQVINDIYIELPNTNGFSISAKVKNIRIENSYASIAVGLQIHNQQPRIEKTIQQFIFRTENIKASI